MKATYLFILVASHLALLLLGIFFGLRVPPSSYLATECLSSHSAFHKGYQPGHVADNVLELYDKGQAIQSPIECKRFKKIGNGQTFDVEVFQMWWVK